MTRSLPLVLALLVPVLLAPGPLAAQSTGGSFGSSSSRWGSSGSSAGSSSSGSSRSESSSSFGSSSAHGPTFPSGPSSSSDFSSRSDERRDDARSGPSEWDRWTARRVHHGQPEVTDAERAALERTTSKVPWWACPLGIFVVVFGLSYVPRRRSRKELATKEELEALLRERMGRAALRRISVGFDWTVREALQRELADLARTLALHSSADRARAASRVLALMARYADGARYAHTSVVRVPLARAPGELDRLAVDLRARFRAETRGRGSAAVPELAPRADEGPGMIVVSVIVGSAAGGPAPRGIRDRAKLREVLASFVVEDELDGLEVIWSPSERDDRLSSYELERIYPELVRLTDAGEVGATVCASCRAPFPRELAECPRCGARVAPVP